MNRLSPRKPATMPGRYNPRDMCEACERFARLAVIAIGAFIPLAVFYVATN